VGHYSGGRIAKYENIGTSSNPLFQLFDESFQSHTIHATATQFFTDIDLDGDFDLFIDWWNTPMEVYMNEGTPTTPIWALSAGPLTDTTGNVIDGAEFCLVDIESDGDEDLFIGVWYSGEVMFYENVTDTGAFSFALSDPTFAGIATGDWSSPAFCDINNDSDYDLFVGDEYGHIWFYENIGDSCNYNFEYVTDNWLNIDVGDHASPEFCDIDDDGDYDLFIGKDNTYDPDPPGAIHYWENIGNPYNPQFTEVTKSYLTFDIGYTLDPDLCDIDNDGDLDLFFMSNSFIGWMKNVGTQLSPTYQLQTYNLVGDIPPGHLEFGDLDGDGDADLLTTHGWSGVLEMWENIGIGGQPEFVSRWEEGLGYLLYEISLGDVDGDSDLDLVAGGFDSYNSTFHILYYENQGTTQNPNFIFMSGSFQGLEFGALRNPKLADVDLDGDLDLLIFICAGGTIWYYENVGTPNFMQLQIASTNLLQDSLSGFIPDCGDLDNDEDVDILIGMHAGGCRFFRNTTGQAINPPIRQHPLHGIELSFGPNPANPVTWVTFHLSYPQRAELAVYNLLGQKIATLASGYQMPGTRTYSWNAMNTSSGSYFIRLETEKTEAVQRLVVLR
jgi:hypothetical protein